MLTDCDRHSQSTVELHEWKEINATHSQLGEELESGLESPLGGLHGGPFIPGSVQGWEAKGISTCA